MCDQAVARAALRSFGLPLARAALTFQQKNKLETHPGHLLQTLHFCTRFSSQLVERMIVLAQTPGWTRGGVVRAALEEHGWNTGTVADSAWYADLSSLTTEQIYRLREDLGATVLRSSPPH
jgi:hypothetical protein